MAEMRFEMEWYSCDFTVMVPEQAVDSAYQTVMSMQMSNDTQIVLLLLNIPWYCITSHETPIYIYLA